MPVIMRQFSPTLFFKKEDLEAVIINLIDLAVAEGHDSISLGKSNVVNMMEFLANKHEE